MMSAFVLTKTGILKARHFKRPWRYGRVIAVSSDNVGLHFFIFHCHIKSSL